MLTYQVRSRVLRLDTQTEIIFPLQGEVRFHLAPQQPFGVEAGGGRTAVRSIAASVLFDANSGKHTVESMVPLRPLDVTLSGPDVEIQLVGSTLYVRRLFQDLSAVTQLIDGVYFALPVLLVVDFADPPIVLRVDGKLADVPFRWELQEWTMDFLTTTQEQQETFFATAWDRLALLAEPRHRRLFAALHYFHVASRLSRAGGLAGEFLAEMLLNLSKVLEVLFPSKGDGKSRDAVREQLDKLGFTLDEIEGDYLPAMALRNEIDVGHVDLSVFTLAQLKLIHGYVERAERAFRLLLARVLANVEAGTFNVPPYDLASAESNAMKIIERLGRHASRYAQ